METIRITKVSCILGPQGTIEIPYNQEFIENLEPRTSTSYYVLKIYKDNQLMKSIITNSFKINYLWEKKCQG